MTKKNLSDLLKEEASTPDNSSADSTQPASSPAASAEAKETSTKSASTRSTSRLTKAELEKQITQLEADLKASQEREAVLTKQVKGLQGDLERQQGHVFELKDALEQAKSTAKVDAEKLKTATEELAEAKQVILKMTKAAEKPVEKSTEKPAVKPAESKPVLSVKMQSGGDIYRGNRRLPPPKPIPEYAIEHGEQKNHMLSNDEIGWVD